MTFFACFKGQAGCQASRLQSPVGGELGPSASEAKTRHSSSGADKRCSAKVPSEAPPVAFPGGCGERSWASDSLVRLIQLLPTLDGGWWSALSEACIALCEHLDADHACIYVLSSADAEAWAAVAACAGLGEAAVAGRAYSCDPRVNASAASQVLRAQQETPASRLVLRSLPLTSSSDCSADTSLATAVPRTVATAGASASNDDLPGDWQHLLEEHSCRHFAAVSLMNADGEPVGVLSLAGRGMAPPPSWTAQVLHSVVGLLAGPLRRAQAVLASPPLSQLHSASTFSDMVQAVADAAADAAAAVAYVRGSSRVAVIHADVGAAAVFQQQAPESENERAASMAQQLLRARRSSCDYVNMPASHIRKSVTHGPFDRVSLEASQVAMAERAATATPDMLKPESWAHLRTVNATNTTFATALATYNSYATAMGTNTPGNTTSFTFPFTKGVPCKGHTLSLDRTLLGEALSKQGAAGLCIDDCQTHTVSTKAYPRDLLLSRTAVMPTSLALATIAADGKPLMALYVTFSTALPKPLLQAVVRELQQLLQAILPTIRAKLDSVLKPEYAYLARQLEDAASRRAESRSVRAKQQQQGIRRSSRSGEVLSSDPSGPVPGAESLTPNPPPTQSQLGGEEGGDNRMLSFILQAAIPGAKQGGTAGAAQPGVGAGAAGREEVLSPFCTPSTPPAALPSPAHSALKQGGTPGRAGSCCSELSGGRPKAAAQEDGGESPEEADLDIFPQMAQGQEVSIMKGWLRGKQGASEADAGGANRPRSLVTCPRTHSACEGGPQPHRRLLNSLRSVSFHLEKAHAPRGASKLAPIIASVHERLKAAQAVQMAFSRSESRKADLQSVKLLQEIGQGGYGTVYRGTYHGAEVAIKLIKQSRLAGVHSSSNALGNSSAGLGLHKQHLHDAIELVTSVSMSHINIVQVPAYFIDVQLELPADEVNPLDSVDMPTESRPFRLIHQPSLVESPAPGQDVNANFEGAMALVLEYCDCGSLCDAIMNRKFIEKVTPKTAAGGAQPGKTYLAINMRSVYSTLLEIALALRHMHSLALVHCDLKPQNVLLKSSPRDPRGFTAKLSDFGLAKMMAHNDQGQLVIDEAVASGTITHVAPEVLLGQKTLGAAVDIYAFGILMFQTLCGMKVYDKTMTPSGIANAVAHRGMRPQMPSWVPVNYRALAEACWEHCPGDRPTADQLVRGLERALEAKRTVTRPASMQSAQA